jgi:hypothetical protein
MREKKAVRRWDSSRYLCEPSAVIYAKENVVEKDSEKKSAFERMPRS